MFQDNLVSNICSLVNFYQEKIKESSFIEEKLFAYLQTIKDDKIKQLHEIDQNHKTLEKINEKKLIDHQSNNNNDNDDIIINKSSNSIFSKPQLTPPQTFKMNKLKLNNMTGCERGSVKVTPNDQYHIQN